MSREMMGGGADSESQDNLPDEQEKKEGSPLTAEEILSKLPPDKLAKVRGVLDNVVKEAESPEGKEVAEFTAAQAVAEAAKLDEEANLKELDLSENGWIIALLVAVVCGITALYISANYMSDDLGIAKPIAASIETVLSFYLSGIAARNILENYEKGKRKN